MRKILVTSALAYANGPLHLGHLLEQIQADIWVRFQKLIGNSCLYLSGDDAHGTPIMISAQKNGITPEELIGKMKVSHFKDATDFLIEFDNYHSTHSAENLDLTHLFYQRALKNQDIASKTINQFFDESAQMFLPDRYLKGNCPKCKASDQYGDNCEQCGSAYSSLELINPRSTISNTVPIIKETTHYFFLLEKYTDFLKEWTTNHLPLEITNKLNEWLSSGLKSWDISRDAPYFGFKIPDQPDKYFYVWLDAPIGYIANFKNLATSKKLNFEEYWSPDSTIELYHFIGKDIIYFHTLFWPALLESSGFRKPTSVFTHGFLTINGQKMSKSRGTFILARDYLNYLDPQHLRYYLASKLTGTIDDLDLNFDDFIQRTNSELVGKIVNIASRSSKFINDYFNHQLATAIEEPELINAISELAPKIRQAYETRNFSAAIRLIIIAADKTNQYLDQHKPWQLAKLDQHDLKIQQVCTVALNAYRKLIIFLKPITPKLALDSEFFLKIPPLVWDDHQTLLLNHQIDSFAPLLKRVDPKKVAELLACSPKP